MALALAAAAVAAPIAQGVTDPNGNQAIDPLAVSYLQGQGFSPGEIKVLIAQATRSPSATCATTASRGRKWRPRRLRRRSTRWPSATCRTRVSRPGEIKVLVGQGDPLAVSYLRNRGFPQHPDDDRRPSAGFNWSDAGIGAGATLGIVLAAGRGSEGALRRLPPEPRGRHVASA